MKDVLNKQIMDLNFKINELVRWIHKQNLELVDKENKYKIEIARGWEFVTSAENDLFGLRKDLAAVKRKKRLLTR